MSGDGNTLAVGACRVYSAATGVDGDETHNSAAAAGAVDVFARTVSGWQQEAYVKASNTQAEDLFGGAVSLSSDGSTIAVCAQSEDSSATGIGNSQTNGAANSGACYLY